MTHRPRKRFGQNFLQDQHVINAILRCISPLPSDNLLEIGPGLGALTKPLLNLVSTLTAIEIDNDLYAQLQNLPTTKGQLKLVHADALTVDYRQFGEQLRIIGNLP